MITMLIVLMGLSSICNQEMWLSDFFKKTWLPLLEIHATIMGACAQQVSERVGA
jgi:hypothetical protein